MFYFILYFFIIKVMVVVTIIVVITSSLLTWWSLFLMMMLMMLLLMKMENSMNCLINYYMVQEMSSMVFLVSVLNSMFLIMVVSVLMKMGAAPFHWWVLSVVSPLNMKSFITMLSINKVPYFLIVIELTSIFLVFILVLGVSASFIQMYSLSSEKSIINLSSTASLNMLMIMGNIKKTSGVVVGVIYLCSMFFLYKESMEVKNMMTSALFNLILLSAPLTLLFNVKILLSSLMASLSGFWMLFLLWSSLATISYMKMLNKSSMLISSLMLNKSKTQLSVIVFLLVVMFYI